MNELHLFAGAGGGILGGLLLGHRPLCAVEIQQHNREILLQRQRDGLMPKFPIWDDIKTFDGKEWRGKVDIVCGGFPCQDISSCGKGAGIEGNKSSLWGEMARVIGEVRPRYCIVENSPLLIHRGLAMVIGDIAAMGYAAKWGVIGAETAGLLHKRERIWILADSEGFPRWDKSQNISDGTPWRCRKEFGKGHENDWVDTATELCRMDDGVAHRVDRLFAIGNGQVPAVAATAWTLLNSI